MENLNIYNRKQNKRNITSELGITIVSLVVTIIVILILAGVTIGTLMGENGVINQAQRTSKTEQQKQTNAQLQINDLETKLATSEDTLTISKAELKTLINQIVDSKILSAYSIGSIYISTSNTNPAEFIGGTWESYGSGRTLVGVDSTQESLATSEKTGGSKIAILNERNLPEHTHNIPSLTGTTSSNGSHEHTVRLNYKQGDLGTMSLPAHSFYFTNGQNITWGGGSNYSINGGQGIAGYSESNGDHTHTITTNASETGSSGNSEPINIQNPYITVYMWKRVA